MLSVVEGLVLRVVVPDVVGLVVPLVVIVDVGVIVVGDVVVGQPTPRCNSTSDVLSPGRHSLVTLLHPHWSMQRRAQVMELHTWVMVVVTGEVWHPLPRFSS